MKRPPLPPSWEAYLAQVRERKAADRPAEGDPIVGRPFDWERDA